MKLVKPVRVYTDGSSRPHTTKVGGWALCVCMPTATHKQVMYGHVPSPTTNMVTELLGVIHALELTQGHYTKIYTDNETVSKAINEWRMKCEANGLPTKNHDLWVRYFKLFDSHGKAEVYWLKGHAGHEGNEIADQFAGRGAEQVELNIKNAKLVTRYFAKPIEFDEMMTRLKGGKDGT